MQMGAGSIGSMECLPFFLVTIESGKLLPNLLSYSWRIRFLWCAPNKTILSSSTWAKEEGGILAVLLTGATCVWRLVAVTRLCAFTKYAAWEEIGICFLITRFLCNLSLISCLNKQVIRVSVGGNFGTWPANQTKYQQQNGAIRQQWCKRPQWYLGATKQETVSPSYCWKVPQIPQAWTWHLLEAWRSSPDHPNQHWLLLSICHYLAIARRLLMEVS